MAYGNQNGNNNGNNGMSDYQSFSNGIGGILGGGLEGLFGNYQNPSQAGMGYLNNLQGQLPGIYSPYIQNGMNSGQTINDIGSNYHQSPGFQFALQQALTGGQHAAAAGGLAGSPQAQQQAMTTATGLANQDYNNYLQNALGVYNTGANMAGQYGQAESNLAASQAQLAYEGQNAQNQHSGGMWGSIGQGLGNLAGFIPGIGPFLQSGLNNWGNNNGSH